MRDRDARERAPKPIELGKLRTSSDVLDLMRSGVTAREIFRVAEADDYRWRGQSSACEELAGPMADALDRTVAELDAALDRESVLLDAKEGDR